MANEEFVYGGDATAILVHPVIGNINLHDNMNNDAIRVSIFNQWTRTLSHKTGDVARAVRRKGLPKIQARIKTQDLSPAVLALIFSDIALGGAVANGITVADISGNKVCPDLGTLTFHPVENGESTAGDIVMYHVRCAPETLEYVLGNVETGVHFSSELVFESVAAAGATLFEIGKAGDTTAPTVSSTTPVDGATGVSKTDVLQVVFSEDMIEQDVEDADNVVLVGGANLDEIATQTRTYNSGTRTLTIGHAAFAGLTAHVLVITKNVRDLAGNQMAAHKVVNFTTIA